MIKIQATLALIDIAITTENISMNGLLTAILMIIWKAICTLLISVVSLVTILEVENWSMLSKEKFWTFLNTSCLRFFANPVDATAPNLADSAPPSRDTRAQIRIIAPCL